MDRIIEDAVREGLHGVARIEARSAPPESILAQSFRPRNATLNVDATQTTSVPHILFNFRVRLTTDERIERLESVLIDSRSASERHTAPIVFGEGVPVSANGIAVVQEVEAHYRAACRALDIPITGGNVSLYNETDGRAILPTPVIGVVGLIEDAATVVRRAFRSEGDAVVLFGETRDE
ncbi:MAG: hypothetical protein AABX36_01785, partial [Candidatus Thermoplasmatota archaeon]